jgi:hypothetical protein
VTSPEQALVVARERAASLDAAAVPELRLDAGEEGVTLEQLFEWAVIEPDLDEVRSTRRYGRPITLTKRLIVRVLRQYLGQITSQQTRFNLQLAVYVAGLADRVDELERRARQR